MTQLAAVRHTVRRAYPARLNLIFGQGKYLLIPVLGKNIAISASGMMFTNNDRIKTFWNESLKFYSLHVVGNS